MRRSALLLAVALLGATVAAIFLLSRPDRDTAPDQDPASFPITFRDDEGVTVTVSSPPQRIVVAAPHLTEFIFAVGAGPKIVGVTGAESRPPEATVLPSVVGADGVTPDVTKINEMSPDLVLASGFPQAQWKQHLRATGRTLVTLHPTGVDDAIDDMRRVGDLLSATKAPALLASITQDVTTIGQSVGSRPGPRVFVEAMYPPLMGVGPAGFTGDLVKRAGGVLVSPAGAAEVFTWSPSELSQSGPQLYLAPTSSGRDVEAIRSRPGFSQLAAVGEGAVHVLPDDVLFSPGPRLAEALAILVKLFHPGLD